MGESLGWASAVLYLSARVAQLRRNHVRRSGEGLSPAMFLTAISANACYGASVLLRVGGAAELARSAAWLVGSLGTTVFDCCIVLQMLYFNRRYRRAAARRLPMAASWSEGGDGADDGGLRAPLLEGECEEAGCGEPPSPGAEGGGDASRSE